MSRAAAAALLLLAAPAAAAPYEAAVSTEARVAAIRVESLNVFDPRVPGEDLWLFRLGNLIHFTTRESVVRRELLLDPGGFWDPLRALESERNLRANGAFRFVEIRAATRPDGRAEVAVHTQDAWTTILQFSAGTEGGENFLIYGAEENNLLGYGKSLGFSHSQVGPRIRNDLRYTDPRLLGSRYRLAGLYATSPKGESFGSDVTRPFYSLDTRGAAGLGWTRLVDEEVVYRDGFETSKFTARTRSAQLSAGRRLERDRWFVQRLEAGWYTDRADFQALPETAPGTLPATRELSGPTVGYSWVRPRYIEETYINKMERVEDFNLGNELRALAGFMSAKTGSDRDRTLFNVSDQQGARLAPGRFALARVGASGRLARGRWENTLFHAGLNLFWKAEWPYAHTWVSHFEGAAGRGLDAENQVVLGGDNGLRGYKNNSLTGARALLWNLENRFFLPGEYFHLFRVGAAAFFESGAVVPEGSGFSLLRFRSDVGAGLRLSSTRSRSGGVFRVDLAYALNRGPGPTRWVVSVRGGQAFELFNSATKRVRQSPASRLNEIAPPSFPELR